MTTATTLKEISFEHALEQVEAGGAFVDVRPVNDYLDVHIPGSLNLEYEFGPGLAGRARDCIPLEVPLLLLDLGHGDLVHVAASLRGKGFAVLGSCTDGLNNWAKARGNPVSTEVVTAPPDTVLDVVDAGATPPEGALRIPIDHLWRRLDEVPPGRVAVAAGYGVRAALAIGIIERRREPEQVVFWRTR